MSDQDYLKPAESSKSSNPDTSLDVDELQMRATLGLSGRGRSQTRPQSQSPGAPKQRHRFVQDGEVQVIHLSGVRDVDSTASFRGRIASLEAALESEHSARIKAEHSSQANLAQLHALETKLAHVEMAHREIVAAERHARELAEAELLAVIAARDAAQLEVREQAAPPPPKERVKRVAKPRAAARVKEPKPVKWWLGKPSAATTFRQP